MCAKWAPHVRLSEIYSPTLTCTTSHAHFHEVEGKSQYLPRINNEELQACFKPYDPKCVVGGLIQTIAYVINFDVTLDSLIFMDKDKRVLLVDTSLLGSGASYSKGMWYLIYGELLHPTPITCISDMIRFVSTESIKKYDQDTVNRVVNVPKVRATILRCAESLSISAFWKVVDSKRALLNS